MRKFTTSGTCRILAPLALVAALAGCGGGMGGIGGGGENAVLLENRSEFIVAPALDRETLVLRSFRGSEAAGWEEVAGATCSVSSGVYQAVVATPARIVVPYTAPARFALLAECRAPGLAGRAEIAPGTGLIGPYGDVSVGMVPAGMAPVPQ